jgi:hypothetical protein
LPDIVTARRTVTFEDEGEAPPIINPLPFIAQGVSEGMSANAIQRALQAAGAGINRQTLLRVVGEVRAAIANRPIAQSINTSTLPTGDQYTKWTTNKRGYSTQMRGVFKDKETGLISLHTTSYTSKLPHTIDTAIANKMSDLEDFAEAGNSGEDLTLIGVIPWNIFEMGPE